MKAITENGEKYMLVSKQSDLDELIKGIFGQRPFANQFKFSERDLFIRLLESLKINHEDFTQKYFYYDSPRRLHISESELGYVWISTYGLIARRKTTTNRTVNACLNQYFVVSLLFKKAIDTVQDERVYDIDSSSNGFLRELSPVIFHNLTFYIEVFCKAYLSLTHTEVPHTNKQHNNSLFQIMILDPLYKFVDHISSLPGDFKEHFIKYDDNPLDDTIIIFEREELAGMTSTLELSIDFITAYFYEGSKTYYLESNIYQRMLEKADTEDKKKKVRELYPHLANINKV
jgi:hypothetical protein